MHETCEAALDFQHGGCCYPGGLRKPAPGFGLQCAIPIGPLPRKGRLAGGHQCNAAVFGAVSQDPDGGPGADPDTEKMLVDRDAKIQRFQKEKYYTVGIQSGSLKAGSGRIASMDEADTLRKAFLCRGICYLFFCQAGEKKTEQPPKLYDLTALQREANRLFGFTAKQTLDYAQQLYEKKLLTYPRTDSQYLTEDMGQTAQHLVSDLLGLLPFAQGLALTAEVGRVLNSKKVSDHHAILPTAEFVKQGFAGLAESESRTTTNTTLKMKIGRILFCITKARKHGSRTRQSVKMVLTEFIPYLKQHCNLSAMEQAATAALREGQNISPEQAAYYNTVVTYVQDCRPLLNQGQYDLPEPPKLTGFDQSLQDYKAQVQAGRDRAGKRLLPE